MLASTVPNPGLYKPASRPAQGKWPVVRTLAATRSPGPHTIFPMPLATRPGDRRQVVANTVPDPGLAVSGSTAAAAGVTHAPAGKTAEWTRTPSFRLVLPSRKSPNLSNSRACVAAHSLFLLKNILVECIRHNRGSKSAIQSPENLPEEPSRLSDDGGSSASRSSRSTPSGELENSSTTSPA